MENKGQNRCVNMGTLLLYGSTLLLSVQFFGSDTSQVRAVLRVLYYCMLAGMVMWIGYHSSGLYRAHAPKKAYFCLAGKIFGVYMVTGIFRYWFVEEREIMRSLMQILLLRKVPTNAEIYFAAAILAMGSAFMMPLVSKILRRPWLAIIVSMALLGVLQIPRDLLGYSFIGVWFGTNQFRCVPLLAYGGYYFLGAWFDKAQNEEKKLPWYVAVGGCVISVGIFLWKYWQFAKTLKFPFSYWEIIFPIGFILVFLSICQLDFVSKKMRWFSEKCFERTVGIICILYFIKVYVGCSELRAVLIPVLLGIIWLAVSAIVSLLSCGRRWLVECLDADEHMKRWQYLAVYTLGFAGLFVLVFLPFFENGVSFIWGQDGVSQYLPKAVYFSQYIREAIAGILNGDFSLKVYDFSIGMGSRVQFSLDPVYWIYALFSDENMETGYQVVTVVRYWLIGLSGLTMLRYFKKNKWVSLLCSYIYAFSGYGVCYVIRHPQFAVPMVLLPLLVIAVEEILRKKKWQLGALLIGVSLLSSYYFLYMNTIALVVYFLVRFFCMKKEEKTFKHLMEYLGIFAGAYILGIGMGCMTIVNSLASYLGSSRSGTGSVTTESLLFYKTSWLTDVYTFFLTTGQSTGYGLRMGFVPLVYLCVVILLLRKGWRELKILMGLSLLCVIFPVGGYVLGGFSSVTNRWCYMLAALAMVTVAETLPLVKSLTRREIKILSVSVIPYVVITVLYSAYSSIITLKACVLLLATLVVVIFASKEVKILDKRGFALVLLVVVAVSLYVGGDSWYGTTGRAVIDEYVAAGTGYDEATNVDVQALVALEDDSFYRVTESGTRGDTLDASMILGLNTISCFSSTINSNIMDYNLSMGNVMINLVKQYNYNNRTFLNALACVKYYSVEQSSLSKAMLPYGYTCVQEITVDETVYEIYENQFALPIGYTYTSIISREELESYEMVEKQEIMLSYAVVESEENLSEDYITSDPVLTGQEIEILSAKCENVVWKEGMIQGEENGSITFYIEGLPNSETYLVFSGYGVSDDSSQTYIKFYVRSDSGAYSLFLKSPEDTYYAGLEDYVINCGYCEAGLTQVTVTFNSAGTIYYDALSIYCQPMTDYEACIAALCEDVLEDVVIGNNTVSGTISLDTSKLLVLSIPYQSGWTAYVDGEKVELLKVNIMYMGVELSEGEHTVVLEYSIPGIKLGLMVTLVSVAVFVTLILFERRKRRKVAE